MIIDCISDLHGHFPKLDGGDLLIVAGDLTARHTREEHVRFQIWLHEQDYKKKVVIAGNHDEFFAALPYEGIRKHYAEMNEDYLCDSGTEFEYDEFETCLDSRIVIERKRKLKIWGSPWSLTFDDIDPRCTAFTGTESELEAKFALIPDDIDILVTHSPPYNIFDRLSREAARGLKDEHVGSKSLFKKSNSLTNLKLMVFGHIHEGYGMIDVKKGMDGLPDHIIEGLPPPSCKSFPFLVNASHVNEFYEPVNKPIRVVL